MKIQSLLLVLISGSNYECSTRPKQNWPSYVTTDLQNPDGLLVQEIAERMSGNICRCSAYPNIINAISQVLESEIKNKAATENNIKNGSDAASVIGIWSPPPSETQLSKPSQNEASQNKNHNAQAGAHS